MALHIEIPALPERDPNRTHDVTRPPHALPPRLDCSREEWRQANDYVKTPCHLTSNDPIDRCVFPKDASKTSVHYSAQLTTGNLVFAEVLTPDLKEAEPRLPSKQNGSGNDASTSASCSNCGMSPVCPRCRKCLRDKYREPRDLPWCSSSCCGYSAEHAIDRMTCMCCVQATFYHCCPEAEEENDYLDNPCGCNYPRCFVRWLFIVVISLFLPCLIFYLPCRGALTLATYCYNNCGSRGCRCAREHPASRPLIEAENASA